MTGVGELNPNRWIIRRLITAVHVTCLLHKANSQLTAEPPAASSDGAYASLDTPRKLLVAVLISAFFFIGFMSIFIRACTKTRSGGSSGGTNHRGSVQSPRGGLDPAVVESLPVLAYSAMKGRKIGNGALECAVCLREFDDEDDRLRLVPICSHVFHADCIDEWLLSHVNCPVCRAELTAESAKLGDEETESETESEDLENSITGKTVNQAIKQVVIKVEKENPAESVVPEANIESKNGENSGSGKAESIDQAMIRDRKDDPNRDQATIDSVEKENRRQGSGIPGKSSRSNSKDQSPVQIGESTERYTLRLSNDLRMRIMAENGSRQKRRKSCDSALALPVAGSSR